MIAKPITEIPAVMSEAMWVDGEPETSPLVIDFRPVLELMARLEYGERDVDRWLIEFNNANHELVGKLELDADGALLITPMLRRAGSNDESEFLIDVGFWTRDNGGEAHGSRLGVRMPNGPALRARCGLDFARAVG